MNHAYLLGVDIGSTTVKTAVVDPVSGALLYHRYERHLSEQAHVAARLIREVAHHFPGARFRAAFSGSGARQIAESAGVAYIQEVVANSLAVRRFFPQTRVAIELGGQDAKVVFFHHNETTGELSASDMRMNGSCAGGTGAFIDEVAKLLRLPVEGFEAAAAAGKHVYEISGRCGVFAKTDIQPLLNQGVGKEDIALSTFHAIAKQTIGGLAQGLEIVPPIIFEGGPLTFNPTLVRVFAERLGLSDEQVLRPDQPEVFIAHGTALSLQVVFADHALDWEPEALAEAVDHARAHASDARDGVWGAVPASKSGAARSGGAGVAVAGATRSDVTPLALGSAGTIGGASSTVAGAPADQFFTDESERAAFESRHQRTKLERRAYAPGSTVGVYIGIDAGSTTTKFVLIDEEGQPIESAYANNQGEPLRVAAQLLRDVLERYEAEGVTLEIRGLGTTGYGERLFARAFHADFHTVETVAHAHAARAYVPDASFVLDIGGQDMKAITLHDEVVTGITLNEACSAGCGSFLENFAGTLNVPVTEIGARAFEARKPSQLGSRCTVFMNSSIITEQKNGKGPNDILAGLCRSIVENVFTKVVRVPNFAALGNTVVVQGGTFENDAVLRAMEQYTGRTVVRAPYPGLMGAIGVALLTRDHQLATLPAASRDHQLATLPATSQDDRGAAVPAGAPAARRDRRPAARPLSDGAAPAHRSDDAAAPRSAFSGLDALERFDYQQQSGHICRYCTNNCNRTLITFADGGVFVTGNRCERGEVIGDAKDPAVRRALAEVTARHRAVPNMMAERERLLFADYPVEAVREEQNVTIGIPRVLEFWNSYPFWSTLWRVLGYNVELSRPSNQKSFERGLPSVPSDTVCFPAKLAHGHLLDLIDRKVDRIFMPMMNRLPPENAATTSDHVCAVVKGYPTVLEVSDEPMRRHGVPFDKPLFHWVDRRARDKQLADYFEREFGVQRAHVWAAIAQADSAQQRFTEAMQEGGRQIMQELEAADGQKFAVVLAGRPYHSDPFINHDLAHHFVELGIPVLTIDSLPGIHALDLSATRAEHTVNFHVRMYAAALFAAQQPNLELVQIVSFGCGHDAVITEEMTRLMAEIADKAPLVLKMDESEVRGPLSIRIRSFLETVQAKRERALAARRAHSLGEAAARRAHSLGQDAAGRAPASGMGNGSAALGPAAALGHAATSSHTLAPGSAARHPLHTNRPAPDPFPVKFTEADRTQRVILSPNVTHSFAKVISSAIRREGYRVEPLPLADRRAVQLGKQYVHNDMCFPAQINVGEALRALESGAYNIDNVACGLAKSQCDCRLANYATLARKALDDAGYPTVPIITNDKDTKNMHPGFKLGPLFSLRMLYGLAMVDALEDLRRNLRPYEQTPGSFDAAFEEITDDVAAGLDRSIRAAFAAYKRGIARLSAIPITDEPPRPKVFVIGEFLLNFHAGSNFDIEHYLEANGMEVVLPNILDSFRRDFMRMKTEMDSFYIRYPFAERLMTGITDTLFDHVLDKVARIAEQNPRYHRRAPLPEVAKLSESIVHHTFTSGEGWMIAGEILHHTGHGVNAHIILQPFGCLPNHVTGRGIVKRLKQLNPHIQILSLDYDPDTSFANIENRLQMLIMNTRLAAAAH